ncbi:hypothetical protein NPIL_51851 [Nephila pilipes]|uniref:Uncharacterized protein n=1 Tax=Nephila pilipes TaxID=299642 RepID=A0A8X6IMW9_NEPPI|nr:hypothetical protein NPIL_51851 [Nephila pilipes]
MRKSLQTSTAKHRLVHLTQNYCLPKAMPIVSTDSNLFGLGISERTATTGKGRCSEEESATRNVPRVVQCPFKTPCNGTACRVVISEWVSEIVLVCPWILAV